MSHSLIKLALQCGLCKCGCLQVWMHDKLVAEKKNPSLLDMTYTASLKEDSRILAYNEECWVECIHTTLNKN